jgi:exodeoxyribonuclease VII large subunit
MQEVALSVSEVVQVLKDQIESQFSEIFVAGEITGLTTSATGHMYFSIAENDVTISCCFFRFDLLKSSVDKNLLKNGAKVSLHASVSIYAKKCSLQLIVKKIEVHDQMGLLKLQMEKLKLKLQSEGLFDLSRKKKIPVSPKKIIVVTSASGAALQDFIKVVARRAMSYYLVVIPTLVQGDMAHASIVKSLNLAQNVPGADLIVLTRGGGSFLDLNCFNHELVARAVASCSIPIITAVGHEVDYTLVDYVSDRRVETPTAAAEFVTEFQYRIQSHLNLILSKIKNLLQHKLTIIQRLHRSTSPSVVLDYLQKSTYKLQVKMEQLKPKTHLLMQRHQELQQSSEFGMDRVHRLLQDQMTRLIAYTDKLNAWLMAVNPRSVLYRGYAIVRSDQSIITSKAQINDQRLHIKSVEFYDGVYENVKVL